MHKPVMMREVLDFLHPKPGDTIVDATIGGGGHAHALLERIIPGGRYIGIDQDAHALEIAGWHLAEFGDSVVFQHANFRNIEDVLLKLGIDLVSSILLDVGISSDQLDDPRRGFGIKTDAPLDMRMDSRRHLTAADVVNTASEHQLEDIIRKYGEERFAKRIARKIVEARRRKPLRTTTELAETIARNVPGFYRHGRIHPATRTFQALRIHVNDELSALESALAQAVKHLEPGGRICVISFHSLEDRIVKNAFREFARSGTVKILTKKPLRPDESEVAENPRSRSARFRVAEKIGDVDEGN